MHPKHRFEQEVGGMAAAYPSPEILKREALTEKFPAIQLVSPRNVGDPGGTKGGWYVETDEDPARVAKALWNGLVAKSKLHYSTPSVHTLTLYIGTPQGEVFSFEPPEKKARKTKGPSVTQRKDELVKKLDAVFGRGAATVRKTGGQYRVKIKPKRKNLQALVGREVSFSAPDLESAHARADDALAKLQSHLQENPSMKHGRRNPDDNLVDAFVEALDEQGVRAIAGGPDDYENDEWTPGRRSDALVFMDNGYLVVLVNAASIGTYGTRVFSLSYALKKSYRIDDSEMVVPVSAGDAAGDASAWFSVVVRFWSDRTDDQDAMIRMLAEHTAGMRDFAIELT